MEGPSLAPAIPGWPRVDGCPMVVREDISQARKASRHSVPEVFTHFKINAESLKISSEHRH